MPYKVVQRGTRWCVVREASDGRTRATVACHDTQKDAQRQMRALYSNVSDARGK